MAGDGPRSWRITEEWWAESTDLALWLRAAGRIDVPPGGVVPGPLDPDIAPSLREPASRIPAYEWIELWGRVVSDAAVEILGGWLGPPEAGAQEFPGLGRWPHLRRLAVEHADELRAWHRDRRRAAIEAGVGQGDLAAANLVNGLGRNLGRPVRPFSLRLIVIPVVDDRTRQIDHATYLVPEGLRSGPGYAEALYEIVTPLL